MGQPRRRHVKEALHSSTWVPQPFHQHPHTHTHWLAVAHVLKLWKRAWGPLVYDRRVVHSHAARWRAGQFSGINGIGIHGAEIEFMRLAEPRRRAAGQSDFNASLNASKWLRFCTLALANATTPTAPAAPAAPTADGSQPGKQQTSNKAKTLSATMEAKLYSNSHKYREGRLLEWQYE